MSSFLRPFYFWSIVRRISPPQLNNALPSIWCKSCSTLTEPAQLSTGICREVEDTRPTISVIDDEPVLLKASSLSPLHGFAGRIAAALRKEEDESKPVMIQATGIKAVNAAVKSIHIAGKYLREKPGIGVCFRVNHQPNADKDRAAGLSFALYKTEFHGNPDTPEDESRKIFRCRNFTRARTFGGHLSQAVIKDEKIAACAVGPKAVAAMIVSLIWARRALHKQNYDTIAIPVMKQMPVGRGKDELCGIELELIRQPYISRPYLDPTEEFNDG